MSSVRHIAKRVGVSVATVSRALNNETGVDPATRERILAAANKSGYAPSVGKRITTVVGLVYPGEPVRPDYGSFESALLNGILRGVAEQRFDVKLISVQRDKLAGEAYTQFFMRKGVRGVILRTVEAQRRMVVDIASEGFPSIVIADRFDEPQVSFIACDSRDDSRRAVEHLIHLGHRRIALVVHNVPDTDHRDRRDGYLEAHQQNDLVADPALTLEVHGGSMDGGSAAMNRLLSMPRPPTAVFFTNPLATVGGLRCCHELGVSVPGELSIVGFDDSDTRSHTWPAYASVCQDASMLGYEASLWLTRCLASGERTPMRLVRPTFLEINKTTARPPAVPVRILPDGSRPD